MRVGHATGADYREADAFYALRGCFGAGGFLF
jgi:hypothetical protein